MELLVLLELSSFDSSKHLNLFLFYNHPLDFVVIWNYPWIASSILYAASNHSEHNLFGMLFIIKEELSSSSTIADLGEGETFAFCPFCPLLLPN